MIYFNSQDLIKILLEEIEQSKTSIEIEMYIWDPDKVGTLFDEALKRAVERGVKVRMIVDRIGSLDWITTRIDEVREAGIDARVFRPIPGLKTLFDRYPKKLLPFLKMFNRRNHRKIFLFDRKTAYVGSLNILEPVLKWKETTLKTQNYEDIQVLRDIFECTWDWIESDTSRFENCDFRKIIADVEHSTNIRTTQTKVLRSHYRKDFLKRIREAKERIWLVTPYFNPPRFLLKGLIEAVGRGVDVRLIVPKKTDPAWFSYLSRVYYSPLLKKGLKVYEYKKGILHSKTALIDSTGMVGSGNLNYRSFYRDLELNMIVTKSEDVQSLHDEFISDMASSAEIKRSKQMKPWERAFGTFLMKFKTSF